ncbi:MAG: hypothetical protein E6R03_04400 [Hyphomicrobiaceae bacterium]|nr:MAG: hypothetical protein E6R03_04400 [Hyphomicrobiaceae bacterium]
MPRNGSGTMSVPNSFSSGAVISSSGMNANFTDIASEITGSLPRDGQAAMTGQLKASSGTVAAPGMAWSSDTDTGFRRSAANTTMAVAGGADIAAISDTGLAMQTGMSITDQAGLIVSGLPTGVMMPYLATTAPTGWVTASGKTIGDASSSATERANADTSSLFSFLWTNFSDSICAVSSGRGVSAAADYAAHKTITLPDLRGRAFFGLDNIGGSAASRLGSIITSATTNGASGGTETVTLSTSQIPVHSHANTISDSHGHTTNAPVQTGTVGATLSGATVLLATVSGGNAGSTSTTGSISINNANAGSGAAHSNMPPAFLGTYIIKL